MRKFSSYGPVNPKLHYYVPREALIDRAFTQLVGEDPDEGGHYITVWAPRQRGKTWVMQQVVSQIKTRGDFDVAILTLQSAKNVTTAEEALSVLITELRAWFGKEFPAITTWQDLERLFSAAHFAKPLILILDEFDAMSEDFINAFANEFRKMYIRRINEADKPSAEKSCLLHGLALVGVRSVLGIESVSGSPFNVQRSVHIPNLVFEEVEAMYRWYERESRQPVEQTVIDQVFYETQGQPGLVSWLGELLTETYNESPEQPLSEDTFHKVYGAAIRVLPNNNILNIVSKAKQEPYRDVVLEMFRTRKKIPFTYDNPRLNFLYLNGVLDWETVTPAEYYVRFSCPFVQKRLFNYFANDMFEDIGPLYTPFEDLGDTFTERGLDVKSLLRRYERYLQENRDWLLKDAPRRKKDLRLYEAVYHFNLYMYLVQFLQRRGRQVWPEFPTGNGKVDLLIQHAGRIYGLEVKSFADVYEYRESLSQAARYGQQLGLSEITLALFVEAVDDANRTRYEVVYKDETTGVIVTPVFVVTETR
jgi:hypothetical protein